MKPAQESQVLLAQDHLALLFPYVPDQIKELKEIPGAKWDKLSRTWRVPLRQLADVKRFAEKHEFWVDPDVLAIRMPEEPFGTAQFYHENTSFYVEFSYDPVMVQSIKEITGVKWNGKEMRWSAPASALIEVVSWADRFKVPVPEDIRQLIEGEAGLREQLVDLSRSTGLDAPIEIAGLEGELMGFQHVGVKYALETKRCFIADEMGLGKTLQAIAALQVGKAWPAVVVCPPTLTLNWVYEIRKWLPELTISHIQGMAKAAYCSSVLDAWDSPVSPPGKEGWFEVSSKKDAKETAGLLSSSDVVVLGYSTLGSWLPVLARFATSVVFDESQYIKTPTAKRTKASIKLAKGCQSDSSMVLCLTGTPITNRPAEYVPQLQALGRIDDFGGAWPFYKKFCNAFKDRWGQWHLEGANNLEELNYRLRATCYVRRKKNEVLNDLDEIRYSVIHVEGDPAVMSEYHKAERDIATFMANRAAEIARELGTNPRSAAVRARIRAESAEHLVRIAALRRLAAKAKMKPIMELVDSHIEDGSKVVLAAHHRDVVDELANKYGGYKIQGGQAPEEVELFKDRFQKMPVDEVPVMVLSIQAAKAGHTLTAAQDIVLVELPWTPADVDQVIARLHRIGQEGSVMATFMLTEGTIDEKLYALLREKRRIVDAATEGGELVTGDVLGDLVMSFAEMGLADL